MEDLQEFMGFIGCKYSADINRLIGAEHTEV